MKEPSLPIETHDGVTLHLTLAAPGERVAALFVDLVLLTLVYAACSLTFSIALDAPALVVLAGFVVRHGYFIVFESRWHGRTPGKRLLGIQIVQRDGPLDRRSVLVRNLVRDVELFFPLVLLAEPELMAGHGPAWLAIPAIAWITVFALLPVVHRQRLRVGDLVAGTLVIRVPEAVLQPDEAAGHLQLRCKLGPEQLAVYGASQLDALARILREVDPHSECGEALSIRVAQTIATKLGLPESATAGDPDAFLRGFYRAQRAFLERQQLHGHRRADEDTAASRVARSRR